MPVYHILLAKAEWLADSATCKTTAPKGPSLINSKQSWVHSSASWLAFTGGGSSLFNGHSSLWTGEGGSQAEGRLMRVGQCCTHLMEGALNRVTLRAWQDGPSAGSATLAALMPREPHGSMWAGGASLCYIASVSNAAATVASILGSQSNLLQGLCPHRGSDLEQWWAGFVSGPTKSLLCGVLQGMSLCLTDFNLMAYLFCWLCLESLHNSSCLFSKQACKYTLLLLDFWFVFFYKKTRAEEACTNKSMGAPLAEGSQQQGHRIQTSSQRTALSKPENSVSKETLLEFALLKNAALGSCRHCSWWSRGPGCELSPALSRPHFTKPSTIPLQRAEVGVRLLYGSRGRKTPGFLTTFLASLGIPALSGAAWTQHRQMS